MVRQLYIEIQTRISMFLAFLDKEVTGFGRPYATFGIFGIINYASYPYWYQWIYHESAPTLYYWRHLLSGCACLLLALAHYWPKKLKSLLPLYFYLCLFYMIPYIITYSFLIHYADKMTWLDCMLGLFVLILMVDWKSFTILVVFGIVVAYIKYRFIDGLPTIAFANIKLPLYTFVFTIITGIFFSRDFANKRINRQIEEARNQENLIRQKQELANLSAQVAHDIRSPLAALQILTEQQLLELPESKRILLRDAVHQIRDITNNLDQNTIKNEKTITQIAVLLEHVLSERRAAFADKSIEITEAIPLESYGYFTNLIPSEIKRVITNIINNAVEAMSAQDGTVNISLKKSGEQIIIDITDNGAGIPKETLDALFTRGFTTKKTGSGLGLFHAKETLNKLGGNIEMTSQVGKGTIVSLLLPVCKAPEWFIDTLKIPDQSILICVDDSISIWNAWQERFQSITHNIDLRYCANKEELLAQLREQNDKPYTYLIDYEFSGKLYAGFDLIKLVLKFKKANDQVYLVTSRSGESHIYQFCRENHVLMIPKFFALKIPVEVIRTK